MTWETPPHLINQACERFNFKPVLDVCATAENRKCKKFITKEIDAFKVPWTENFFMNPEFNDKEHPLYDWVGRASEQAFENNVSGLCLLPCYTDSKWWQKFIGDKMQYVKDYYFLDSRVKFLVDGREYRDERNYLQKYEKPCIMVLI